MTKYQRQSDTFLHGLQGILLVMLMLLGGCGNMARMPADVSFPLTNSPAPTETVIPTALSPTVPPSLTPMPTYRTHTPTPTPTQTLTPTTPAPEASEVPVQIDQEILFLRSGNLVAADVATKQVRMIARGVSEFAASPDGTMLAVVRGSGLSGEIWLVSRDGKILRQLTHNRRSEGQLSWNNNGSLLVYASTTGNGQNPSTRIEWASWCHASEIRLIDLETATEKTIEPGCAPAFSPDGRRIAFATPPEQREAGIPIAAEKGIPTAKNTIRLINSKGENGWSFAVADAKTHESGLLVYAPSWSRDGTTIVYQRFIGYQVLVDMNYTEAGGSFTGGRDLMGAGSGWLFPALMAPDNTHMAIVEYDAENARGWGGYEQWRVQVFRRGEVTEMALPEGPRERKAATVATVARGAGAAWAPENLMLALLLPPGWSPEASPYAPQFEATTPGDVWFWEPETSLFEPFVEGVDYASPLLWLPAMPIARD